ncbi:hypothetical protein OQA88_8542 [Cercophora sp. LCS_1]
MASKSPLPPAVQEPQATKTAIAEKQSRFETASSGIKVAQETRLQKYQWGGELAGPAREEPESPTEGPTTYTVIVEHHDAIRRDAINHKFFDWVVFDQVTLEPKDNFKKSRRDKAFESLNELKLGLPGEVEVEGLGGLFKSAHNLFHSSLFTDFQESKRDLLVPSGSSKPEELSQRDLARVEAELFDFTRYHDSCNFLTALSWSEDDDDSGSISLYEVLSDSGGNATGVRPVAAMQNIPNKILVKIRENSEIKKTVFVPSREKEHAHQFRWTARHSHDPKYVKLGGSGPRRPSHGRDRSRDSRDSHESRGPKTVDADGIQATIPQFVALLHGSRSVLENVQSTHATSREIRDGRFKTAVNVENPPRRNPHQSDKVHVVVLIPDESEWAEEHILWTDTEDKWLFEFKQKRYRELIRYSDDERRDSRGGRSTSRHSTHSHSHSRSHSRNESPDSGSRHPRSRSRAGHEDEERSRSRRLLHKLF